MSTDTQLRAAVARQPYPLLYMVLSGAHLYGFPSPDSDYDLRGVHILPVREVVGLLAARETVTVSTVRDGLAIDLVTHDVHKAFTLLLKKDCTLLEHIYSPLALHTTPGHAELQRIARDCLTRHHYHPYLAFARAQWRLFERDNPRRVKPLLYVYRVLLTGMHLMRTGEVEANLVRLNEMFKLPYIPDLIARKLAGPEHALLAEADLAFHEGEYARLCHALEEAHQASRLPEAPAGKRALHDLLVRLRLQE